MNSRLNIFLLLATVVVLFCGCGNRGKKNDTYFEPYQKDTTQVSNQQGAVLDSLSETEDEIPLERGVDFAHHHYMVVVASYSIEELAVQRKKDMQEQGFNADLFMINDDGWHKLALESYKTKEEANKAMLRIRKKGGFFANARVLYKE